MSKKNYKAAVRKLASEKGITYAAAKKIYDRKTGRFRALVLEMARIGDEWRKHELSQWTDEERRRGGKIYDGAGLLQATIERATSPYRKQLLALLSEVSDGDLRKLKTLMYYGRDQDRGPVTEFHAYINRGSERRGVVVSTMLGKMPLARYLRDGLELADSRREDVEGAWE